MTRARERDDIGRRLMEGRLPIRVFIQDDGGFTPEQAEVLILAFEYTLRKVGSVKRTDTVALNIAKQIIAAESATPKS